MARGPKRLSKYYKRVMRFEDKYRADIEECELIDDEKRCEVGDGEDDILILGKTCWYDHNTFSFKQQTGHFSSLYITELALPVVKHASASYRRSVSFCSFCAHSAHNFTIFSDQCQGLEEASNSELKPLG
ncbi:hypothetical protein GQ600_8767 [Phytophthora cactorum]|nr:hypothetical protein GQ600_8767 [Phytophthora cactorum]